MRNGTENLHKKKLFEKIDGLVREGRLTHSEKIKIKEAHKIAVLAHFYNQRETGEKFVSHVERSSIILIEAGFTSARHVIVELLHDVMEDADRDFRRSFLEWLERQKMKSREGEDVHRALHALSRLKYETPHSEPVKKTDEEYFGGMKNNRLVWISKSAERLDNLNTCELWSPTTLQNYLKETLLYVVDKAMLYCPHIGKRMAKRIAEIQAAIVAGRPPRRFTPTSRAYLQSG